MNWFGKSKKENIETVVEDTTAAKPVVDLPQNKFKLAIADETAEQFYDILGITEERAEKISKIVEDCFDKHELLHASLEEIVDSCTHTNEIVFATLVFTKVQEHRAKKEIAHMIMSQISKRERGHGDD